MQANTSDKCYVYFDKEPVAFANYIKSLYKSDDVDYLNYHDGLGDYSFEDADGIIHDYDASLEADDNSYRYSGTNPNNYVCFGSDVIPCPENNLYRILGIFDDDKDGVYQVKLVMNDIYDVGVWDASESNDWEDSSIRETLNTDYLSNLGGYADYIALSEWRVGPISYDDFTYVSLAYDGKNIYNAEITDGSKIIFEAKVGLIYPSDFVYAHEYSSYPQSLDVENWMFKDIQEWTIIPTDDPMFLQIVNQGSLGHLMVADQANYRPSFYLQPWVLYSGGDGTESNPYRISAPENLISFTISGITYYAEEGMTWENWINSVYNNDGFVVYSNGVSKPQYGLVFKEMHQIEINEIIENNTLYQFGSSGGGM